MIEKREQWGSKAGFILAAAGSAIGLGNIWKFPYIAGENGGAAFVLVYLICILLIGTPVLIAEILLGRETQKNSIGAFKKLADNKAWMIVGGMGILAGFVILSFYSVIGGWAIGYIIESIKGTFFTFENSDASGALFGSLIGNAQWVISMHTIFFAFVMILVGFGVKKGIEFGSKVLMPILFVILVVLMVRGMTLDGAQAGIDFMFKPDWSKINSESILIALGHAFFTLSLGMGAMLTYGSYMNKGSNILTASLQIIFLDTLIAIMAGVAIFTAVFASGLVPGSGPGLIFQTLPLVFAEMPGGYAFSILFFLLLAIAALTSAISLLEVVVAYFVDEKKWSRKKAVIIFGAVIYLVGIPSGLSFNLMSDMTLFNKTFFDLADFLASNILLPLGGLFISIFVAWVWGFEKAIPAVMKGTKNIAKNSVAIVAWKVLLKYLAPIFIFIIFLHSIGLI